MVVIHLLFFFTLLVEISRGQNVTMPTDILQHMKESLEAAGAGSINFGPGGILGNLGGQFGVKINKEQTTSGNTAKLVGKTKTRSKLTEVPKIGNLGNDNTQYKSLKNMKNCFGIPIYVPVINIVTTPPSSTTTGGAPDARGDSTTTAAP